MIKMKSLSFLFVCSILISHSQGSYNDLNAIFSDDNFCQLKRLTDSRISILDHYDFKVDQFSSNKIAVNCSCFLSYYSEVYKMNNNKYDFISNLIETSCTEKKASNLKCDFKSLIDKCLSKASLTEISSLSRPYATPEEENAIMALGIIVYIADGVVAIFSLAALVAYLMLPKNRNTLHANEKPEPRTVENQMTLREFTDINRNLTKEGDAESINSKQERRF